MEPKSYQSAIKLTPDINWKCVINALQQVAGVRIVIGGSAQLWKQYIRQMKDVDAFVHPKDWDKLLDSRLGVAGVAEPTLDLVYRIKADKPIEIFKTSWPRGYAYHEMSGYDVMVKEMNIHCWTIEQTLRWKTAMGRPKDLADIRALQAASQMV